MGGATAAALFSPLAAAKGQDKDQNRSGPQPSDQQPSTELTLRLRPTTVPLRDSQQSSALWDFDTTSPALPRFIQGNDLKVSLANDLPVPVSVIWRSVDGVAPIEPLLGHSPLAPGQTAAMTVPLRSAGTVLCDARLLGDRQQRSLPLKPIIVEEKQAVAVDGDHVVLIEDWRLLPDGSSLSPGQEPAAGATTVFTVNGKPSLDIPTRSNARLRVRFINGCQRSVIALKIDNHDVRVMAIDGEPAEPFLARNGGLIMAPGTRVDAWIDATGRPSTTATIQLHDGTSPRPIARLVYEPEPPLREAPLPAPPPLPSNGLPQKLELQGAFRVDIPLDGSAKWLAPTGLTTSVAPAFRIKRGRTAVLTLTNRATNPAVFNLHGHHFRLLDRLDDGWKPFWLDTLILDAGQTQRVAFAAETGSWLMEAMETSWEAPRRLQWFAVD